MGNRAKDWLSQAERDLDLARASGPNGRHEWACFAAQQAAEKAVKALHLFMGQEAWGHVVARLIHDLPIGAPEDLIEKGRVLDNFCIPTRYANSLLRVPPSSTMGHYKARRPSSMPVRSLNSSVFVWPSRKAVERAIFKWAEAARSRHEGVLLLGYFGSYARGDWGVGSDLDLVAVVRESSEPFEMHNLSWDLKFLPVHAELIVYTWDEWKKLQNEGGRFAQVLSEETIWLFKKSHERSEIIS